MKIKSEEIQEIQQHLQDDCSKAIFANRILYSLTEDLAYLRNIFFTIPEGMEFLEKLKEHSGQKKILFGAGQWGRWIKKNYDNIDWDFFADNHLNEEEIEGLPVLNVTELVEQGRDTFIVITSKSHWKEIFEQLRELGIPKEQLYCVGEMIAKIEDRIYFDLPILPHTEKEIFVDAGGFDGMSAVNFCKWSNEVWEKIYIFEPDKTSQLKCANALQGKKNVEIVPKGLWSREDTFSFVENGSESKLDTSGIEIGKKNNDQVEVISLDQFLQGEKVTFIKMDIEGAEWNALLGSEETIRKHKPKLAISIYHQPEDVLTILSLLLKFNPQYRFWIRHYSLSWFDTILYAV